MSKRLSIKLLKGKHKDETIYVFGSGHQGLIYDMNWFKDKIIIGMNFMYKFIKTDYLISRHLKVIKQQPKNLVCPLITADFQGFEHTFGDYLWTNELVESGSTVLTATDFARYLGASKIVILACEGYGSHRPGYNEFVSPDNKEAGEIGRPYLRGTDYNIEHFIEHTESKYGIEIFRSKLIVEQFKTKINIK